MRHLSLTGFDAGVRICGAPRSEPAYHAAYIDFSAPYAANICPACKAEWDAALEEEE